MEILHAGFVAYGIMAFFIFLMLARFAGTRSPATLGTAAARAIVWPLTIWRMVK